MFSKVAWVGNILLMVQKSSKSWYSTYSSSHYLQGFSTIPGDAGFQASTSLTSAESKDSLFQDVAGAHCRGSVQIQNRSLWQGGMIRKKQMGAIIWYLCLSIHENCRYVICTYMYVYIFLKKIAWDYTQNLSLPPAQKKTKTTKRSKTNQKHFWTNKKISKTSDTTNWNTYIFGKSEKKPEFLERPAAGGHQLMADWWELVLEPNWIGKALHPEQGRELLGSYKGVSKNRGTSKWMVYNGTPY